VCSSFQSGVDRWTSRLVPAISSVATTPTSELSAACSGGFQGQTVRDAARLADRRRRASNPRGDAGQVTLRSVAARMARTVARAAEPLPTTWTIPNAEGST
jgi:hypothetical protein